MTLDEIKNRVRHRLDESDTASLRYPDSVTQDYIIDGIRFYVTKTGCHTRSFVVTQTANTLFYDLPCDCIQVTRVLWKSPTQYISVLPITARDLDEQVYRWQRTQDIRARNYFLLGLDQLALWPMSPDGGEQYIVHYRRDIYSGLTVIPEQDHGILINYAVGRHLLAERKANDGIREMAIYAQAVAAAKQRYSSPDRVWAMTARGI